MLQPRPTIDNILASLLPPGWSLRLIHWRDDDRWEVHLLTGDSIWFGYADTIESAIDNAANKLQGSASLHRHQPANQPAIDEILRKLRPKQKIDLGLRI